VKFITYTQCATKKFVEEMRSQRVGELNMANKFYPLTGGENVQRKRTTTKFTWDFL